MKFKEFKHVCVTPIISVTVNNKQNEMIAKNRDNNWYIYTPCSNILPNASFTQLRFAKMALRAEFEDGWHTIYDEITNGGY